MICWVFQVQWVRNQGRCGVCGDPYHGPRDHEAGGKFANGIVTRTYKQGDIIPITVHLTANHQVNQKVPNLWETKFPFCAHSLLTLLTLNLCFAC